MSNHPPILPDSPHFLALDDGTHIFKWPTFFMGKQIEPTTELFSPTSREQRFVISCVATVEWSSEAVRWAKMPVNDCKTRDTIADLKALAESNAAQWVLWGMN